MIMKMKIYNNFARDRDKQSENYPSDKESDDLKIEP